MDALTDIIERSRSFERNSFLFIWLWISQNEKYLQGKGEEGGGGLVAQHAASRLATAMTRLWGAWDWGGNSGAIVVFTKIGIQQERGQAMLIPAIGQDHSLQGIDTIHLGEQSRGIGDTRVEQQFDITETQRDHFFFLGPQEIQETGQELTVGQNSGVIGAVGGQIDETVGGFLADIKILMGGNLREDGNEASVNDFDQIRARVVGSDVGHEPETLLFDRSIPQEREGWMLVLGSVSLFFFFFPFSFLHCLWYSYLQSD